MRRGAERTVVVVVDGAVDVEKASESRNGTWAGRAAVVRGADACYRRCRSIYYRRAHTARIRSSAAGQAAVIERREEGA